MCVTNIFYEVANGDLIIQLYLEFIFTDKGACYIALSTTYNVHLACQTRTQEGACYIALGTTCKVYLALFEDK